MKRSCGLCCLLLQLGLAVAAKAQVQDTGSVTGVVRNIISDQPITEAIVSVNETSWYAPGIGLIKMVREETTESQALDKGKMTIELEKFG